jgi:hypothetical protein
VVGAAVHTYSMRRWSRSSNRGSPPGVTGHKPPRGALARATCDS